MMSKRSSKILFAKSFRLILIFIIVISLNVYTGNSQINDHSTAGFSAIQTEMGPYCLNCHPEKNNTLFASSGHSILDGEAGIVKNSDCWKCHNADNGTLKGNYLAFINATNPSDDIYSRNDFSICFNCHSEKNLLSAPQFDEFIQVILNQSLGIPLYTNSWKTNFYGDSWWKNDQDSNLHFFHLVELRAMGGVPSTGAYCKKCHNPHGTTNPRFIVENITFSHLYQNGSIINNSDDWNQNHGSTVTGFNGAQYQFCKGCHDNDNKYMRDMIEWRACGLCHDATTSTLSTGSHSTHFDSTGRGAGINSCDTCHGANATNGNHTGHYDGIRNFADGKDLVQTAVCDGCHSSGGTYNGVDNSTYGAKANWKDGVYNESNGLKLQSGKDEWCAGCHDEVPSLIQGIEAPNIVGDGVNYGYYVTGHGENNIIECDSCHNLSSRHIDGITRTYSPDSDYSTYDPASDSYQNGYRLKDTPSGYNGSDPMHIPRTGNVFPPGFRQDWEFALCFECHDRNDLFNGGNPINGSGAKTNFRENYSGSWLSLHNLHTDGRNGPWGPTTPQYDSDFNGTADSRISCPACHNVHGSRSPAMVRTGELIGKTPALNLKYIDNLPGSPLHFISQDMLNNSTGAGMDVSFGPGKLNSNGVCNMCHAQQTGGPEPHTGYYRNPLENVPDFSNFHVSPVDMVSCIQSGCHYSNILTVEHVENRGLECATCHKNNQQPVIEAIEQGNKSCFACHTPHTTGSHITHIGAVNGPQISCSDCHGTQLPPLFADTHDLTNTSICNNCHSTDGAPIAKTYWDDPGSWMVAEDEAGFCGSCHDSTPGNTLTNGTGDDGANVLGDNSTYGFYVTGHGKKSGFYERLSLQDTLAVGNPVANVSCSGCHNLTSPHFQDRRLRVGYENDEFNEICNNCHISGIADTDPKFYTNSADFEASAHGNNTRENPLTGNPMLCTDCHDVHGTAGAFKAMTRGDKQNLCYQCHTDAMVSNDALSNNRPGGYISADDIQEAFAKSEKHNLGTAFTLNNNNYSLECISCHNVHIINGKYWDAEVGKSPVTRFTDNTQVWGDETGEKMDDFAALGSGTGGWYYKIAQGYSLGSTGLPWDQPAVYQPPKSGSGYDFEFGGDVLPDYTTFCLDCHSSRMSAANPPVNWGQGIGCTDNSIDPPNQRIECGAQHGLGAAGKPLYVSDEGTAGFWGSSGNPDAIFNMNYVTRGRHNGHLMRWPYDSAERGAGINFVLSCTDCHEAHGSNRGGMVRERFNVNANGDCGTGGNSNPDGENCNDGGNWNSFCNACHYYYGGQHAGMSCGSASCHEANSIHRIIHTVDSGAGTQLMLTAAGYESNYTRPDFTPEIDSVIGYIGSNELTVKFTAGVWTNSDLTGVLKPDDFWLFDTNNDNPRTITGVTHTAGEANAIITMSSPLIEADLSNDILSTTGKSVWNWYEGGYNNWATGVIPAQAVSAGPWPVTISGPFAITTVEGMTGYDQLNVEFTEGVYANTNGTGALLPSDFSLYDADNSRSIISVQHLAGGSIAVLTLSIPLDDAADINTDSIGGVSDSIYNIEGFTLGTGTVTIIAMSSPAISAVEGVIGGDKLKVTFSEPVYTAANMTGALAPADFILSDTNDDNPRTITAVQHTPGAMLAIINMSSPLINADIGADTLAAAGGSIFDRANYPIGIETVTITAQTPPAILKIEGVIGYNKTLVSFSEGVYSNKNQSGALEISDFTLTDNDNTRIIINVEHVAGQPNVILTLNTSLDGTDDIGIDTLAAATSSSIFNNIDTPIGTETVNITGTDWPVWGTSFQFNEPAGSPTITDESGLFTGTVNNSNMALPGDGYFHGNESQSTYIDLNNDASLKEPKTITLETRVFTSLVDLDTDDINRTSTQQRIIDRKRSFQLTIFRGDWMTNWTGSEMPRDQARVILKYRVPSEYRRYCDGSHLDDDYVGDGAWWKQVSVDRDDYPIVLNHWYRIKVVFDSGRPTVPVNIWIDDEGTDGHGAGENWAGYKNVGRPDPWDSGKCKFQAQPGDEMLTENQLSYIGSPPNHNSLVLFKGWIDWVTWKPVADYSGVDDSPV